MTEPFHPGLYQRLLGDEFARLAPVIQQFHSLGERATAAGTVDVEVGGTTLARLVARLAGLPRPAEDVKVRLVVTANERGERWERWFGDRPLVSHQWAKSHLLIESFGAMAIGFGLVVQEGGMRFVPRRLWLLGLPWPRILGPRVEATTTPAAEGWQIDVRLALPFVGHVVRYQGTMKPL